MTRTPDAAFIERAKGLADSIATTTVEQVAALVADAEKYGTSSVEYAYALALRGLLARYKSKDEEAGAEDLERALAIAESEGVAPEQRSTWCRTLSVVYDDLAQAQKAIDSAEKAHALITPLAGRVHPQTLAATGGLFRTMRCGVHPIVPELRELATIWPSMNEPERKVQLVVLQRFVHRRKDLSKADAERLQKITAEPQSIQAVLPPPEPKADKTELAAVLAELGALVGLREVKAEVNRLSAVLQVEEMRRAAGLPLAPRANHFVFLGPPGTGKTTIARLLGRLFKALGILAKGHVVEVDRSGLVAGFIGQTAIKVNEAVDSALDGVLFVDEAYALLNESERDFGHEAVATLLKRMEDERGRLVVVLAGYDDPMLRMLEMNPGLKSRFTTTLEFRTYRGAELAAIFTAQAERVGYLPTAPGLARVREICGLMRGSEDPATFGNAREIRNLFEDSVAQQASRLVAQAERGRPPTKEELQRLEAADIHWDKLGNPELRDTLTGDALRTVAVHELGHALVGRHVDGPPPVLVSTIPCSGALGRTFFAEDERGVYTRAQLIGRAARALGGRAAEQVLFGVLTSGAAHDLAVAERIALEMLVTGMSEEIPGEALAEYADTVGGGRGGHLNDRTRREVGELLQEAYALAVEIVRAHEPTLREAAELLVERRTLHADDLARLFGGAS